MCVALAMDSRKKTKKERKKAICSELSTAVKKVRSIIDLPVL